MTDENKLKNWTLGKWKKEFWKTFSEWVRKSGKGICFTCGIKKEWKEQQAGHFKPAGSCGLAIYFHEDNVKCQCYRCNINLQGNQYEFGIRLGEKKVKELEKIAREKKDLKYSARDYLNLINKYKQKLKEYEM